jgi:hypothetical protein
LRRHPEDALG